MARADLLIDIIKYGLNQDSQRFRKTAESICAEEKRKQHGVLAERIEKLLQASTNKLERDAPSRPRVISGRMGEQNFFIEKTPDQRIADLVLPSYVSEFCDNFIDEQLRSELLRSYGLEPRNKILLVGAPGNGKTSLAEGIAEALMLPFFTVRYEHLIGSYLGETASRLGALFDYVKTKPCVLFFDEFETLGKERGDTHETGEIKRVVSSLLLQIDSLPSYVIVVAATNHDSLLDHAAWRRFQIKVELPLPTRANLEKWYALFERRNDFSFGIKPSTLAKRTYGISYAEAEEFALSVFRQYVLSLPLDSSKQITDKVLDLWKKQHSQKTLTEIGENDGAN